jgi:triacylglycerol lipase
VYSVGGTAVLTNPADPADSLVGFTSTYFAGAPNDGLVGKCSSHFGQVLRDDYPWNHLDEVNMSFGLRNFFAPDPVAFYRTQANRLKQSGL